MEIPYPTTDRMRVYDLAMTHRLDADPYFIHRVQAGAAAADLDFFLIEPLWAEAFLQGLESGSLFVRALINMHSEHHQPEELFHRLIRSAHHRGVQVIDPPDVAIPAFDKARFHPVLVKAGLPVPETLIVSDPEVPGISLPPDVSNRLGTPFVIKPAMGYGRKGVILDATGEKDLLRARSIWKDTHYLLQRRISPVYHGNRPVYVRIYHVFDEIFPVWWDCFTDRYQLVSPADHRLHEMQEAVELVRRVAAISGMQFFSSELARQEDGTWILIDYVNDQCHLTSQSADPAIGVPDSLVASIARSLVHGACKLIRL